MRGRAAPRLRSRPGSTGWDARTVLLGLLIAGGLAAIDSTSGSGSIVISTVVLAPFVVSLLSGPAETTIVTIVAVALAVVSGAWHHNFDTPAYHLRWAVVLAGGVVSVLVASARERTLRDRERFELLAAVAEVADGRLTLEETAAQLCALAVPDFADVCVIDVVHEDGLRRLAVRAWGRDAQHRESQLRTRPLPTSEEPGVGAAVASGRSQLLTPFSEQLLRAIAQNDDDLAMLRSLGATAAIVVPLNARGRTLGALTMMVTGQSGRSYGPDDQRFVEVLSGRIALGLDNAGLFSELQTMESQLTTALGNLAEAVTVQNRQGNLIYANQAAAELMGFGSPQEVLAQPGEELVGRYQFFHEDGSPLNPSEFPGRRVLAGEPAEPLVMRVVDAQTGEQRWRMTKASAVLDSAGAVRMVVNVIADITSVKRAELAQQLLARASDVLNSSLELAETLQQVADLCVPDLADWCTVRLPDGHGNRLQSVAVAHADPDKLELAWSTRDRYAVGLDEPAGIARVFRDARPQYINDVTDEMLASAAVDADHLDAMRKLAPRAVLLLPMIANRGPVGVLSLVTAQSGRTFGEEDIALASELARRAASAVENARLYTERTRIARTLQESLLPAPLPTVPGWRTSSLYRPAGDEERVGGDFYEVFALDDDSWMLVVGDVTGRGAPAAALTALMRHTLRSIATFTASAASGLEKLNRDLAARPQPSLCTAVCIVLREHAGEARADIICAGHPLPLLIRGGAAQYVGRFGPMLGAFPDETWSPVTVTLEQGDILVLYSDGVLDAKGPEDRFGPERLQATLASARSAADAVARIEEALTGFQVGSQFDDTAVLAVERVDVPDNSAADDPHGSGFSEQLP